MYLSSVRARGAAAAAAAAAGLAAAVVALGAAAIAAPLEAVFKGHKSGVVDIAWHPAGALLASAGSDGQVLVWNVGATGAGARAATLGGFKTGAVALAFRPPKGDQLAVGDAGGGLTVFDTAGWKRVFGAAALGDAVDHVEYSPNGNELAIGYGESAAVLTVPEYERDRAYKVPPMLTDLAWAPFSDALALASLDGTASVWPLHGDVGRVTLTGHDTGLSDVAFSPDGRTIATADAHGMVRLWDAINGTVTAQPLDATGSRVWELAWTKDSAFLATAGADGKVTVFSAASGKEVKSYEPGGGAVKHVAFSPDGRLLAATTTTRVFVWRVDSGAEVATMSDHKEAISALAWSPDGKRLATGSDDDVVRVWTLASPGP
jgi:WD40 repeat protein